VVIAFNKPKSVWKKRVNSLSNLPTSEEFVQLNLLQKAGTNTYTVARGHALYHKSNLAVHWSKWLFT
jgi:hypothetical protein